MRRTQIVGLVAIVGLAAGALLIPSAGSAKPGFPEHGFSPVLIPSSIGVNCAPGHKFGTSVGAVRIGIHYTGTGHLYGAKTVTVTGLPGHHEYTLSTPHYTAVIPAGTRMPCIRPFNKATWTPNSATGKPATKKLFFTHCASPHC
jgi:hypothetical protein